MSHSPAYEEFLARRWAGETMQSYAALSSTEQAMTIAAYRATQLLDAVLAHERGEAVKRANAAQRNRSKK